MITEKLEKHYVGKFRDFGATPKGVDWNDQDELLFRYDKLMSIIDYHDKNYNHNIDILDVGCGYGGLCQFCSENNIGINYTGLDIAKNMIDYATNKYPNAEFIKGDILHMDERRKFDYVICNGLLTLKLDVSNIDMEKYANNVLKKMYALCKIGIANVFMSTRVNFFSKQLYYRSPAETLDFCLHNLSSKVVIDHGYSSLDTNQGKFYDYIVSIFK